MPDSYGASLAAVGLRGPSRLDVMNVRPAKAVARTNMVKIGR
jgi:hypothetical protein